MSIAPRSPRLYKLFAAGRLHEFKKDQEVSSTDDPDSLMLLAKGYVKRFSISNDGSLGVQIIYGPQDLFSLTKVFHRLLGQSLYDGPEVYYYKAICDTKLYVLDAALLQGAVEKDPLFYKELFSEAGHHLEACVHSIENISLTDAYARVAHELLFLAKQFGKEQKDGVKIMLPLTHQDLADLLGVTRETVTKAIIRLRQQGLISTNNQRFCIADLHALEHAAYG